MWRYIVRRLLWVVLVLLVITLVTYVIFFVMSPGDPAAAFAGRSPTPDTIAEVKRQFGLDKPVWEQYGLFVRRLFGGDQYGWPGLGFSFVTRSPIKPILFDRLVITAQLALGAALVWLCIGIPIGIISAVRRRSLLDRLSMGLALFFVSAPVFWLGHMWLPWVVLALLFAAFYARMTRGNLIETMAQDYIRTARVKGLPEWKVIYKHDLPAILAVTMVTATAITVMNLIVDIVYAYLDPRVRYT